LAPFRKPGEMVKSGTRKKEKRGGRAEVTENFQKETRTKKRRFEKETRKVKKRAGRSWEGGEGKRSDIET